MTSVVEVPGVAQGVGSMGNLGKIDADGGEK
jgi:hypothetical protein